MEKQKTELNEIHQGPFVARVDIEEVRHRGKIAIFWESFFLPLDE